MSSKAMDDMGAGLENLGGTCYINCVLQALTHTVPLLQSLQEHNGGCFCLRSKFISHFEKAFSFDHAIAPYSITDNLSEIGPFHSDWGYSEIFLQRFLEKLDLCGSDERKIARNLFGIKGTWNLSCLNCNHSKVLARRKCSHSKVSARRKYNICYLLQLDMGDSKSLMECLNKPVAGECPNCNEYTQVIRPVFLGAPIVAVFVLKSVKDPTKVLPFPQECYMRGDKVNLKYKLYGVIVAIRVSESLVHCISFIQSSPNKWYKLDDLEVSKVTMEDVMCKNAIKFIPFYVKNDSPWFSSLNKEQWFLKLMEERKRKAKEREGATSAGLGFLDDLVWDQGS